MCAGRAAPVAPRAEVHDGNHNGRALAILAVHALDPGRAFAVSTEKTKW